MHVFARFSSLVLIAPCLLPTIPVLAPETRKERKLGPKVRQVINAYQVHRPKSSDFSLCVYKQSFWSTTTRMAQFTALWFGMTLSLSSFCLENCFRSSVCQLSYKECAENHYAATERISGIFSTPVAHGLLVQERRTVCFYAPAGLPNICP